MTSITKPVKVIEARKKWKLFDFRELVVYRDLIYFLVLRDVTVLYKQTVLGILWAVLNPLLNTILFTFVFGKLAEVPNDGIPYPIFYYSAFLPWVYFSQALIGSSNSLIQGAAIFTKVYFPRIIIPITPVFSKLVDFVIGFSILVVLMIYYGMFPGLGILMLPVLIIMMIVFTFGLGMWLSSLAVQYRDVRFAMPFLIQFLMFVSPLIYPASQVKDKLGETVYMLYGLYPMSGIIEGFRSSLLSQTPMPWDLIGLGAIGSIIVFLIGLYQFKKSERFFADVV